MLESTLLPSLGSAYAAYRSSLWDAQTLVYYSQLIHSETFKDTFPYLSTLSRGVKGLLARWVGGSQKGLGPSLKRGVEPKSSCRPWLMILT